MSEAIKVIAEQNVLGKEFNIYGTIEEPLFMAKDVAELIDYAKTSKGAYNVSMMLDSVDDDEKLISETLVSGQNRKVWFVREYGLYEVLMQSQKPIAKKFKKEVKRKLRQAQRFVSDGLNAIKDVFSGLRIKLPHIKLPHFNVYGGKPPYGLGGVGSAPKFSIDWYAKGGIFDGASLIGVGERGREAVLPIETPRYMRPLARTIANEMPHGGGVVINLTYNAGEDATQMVRDMARAIRAQRMMEA